MFKSLFAPFLLATVVFAQGAVLNLPTYNQTVSAGSNLIVQVERPVCRCSFSLFFLGHLTNHPCVLFVFQDTLTGSEEIAVVIGVQSCATRACIPPSELLGTILYNGPFNPQFPVGNVPPYQPFENFTVQIPSTLPTGTALIGVAHFTLIGVS